MTDYLRPELDELVSKRRQRPMAYPLRQRQPTEEIAEIVCQREKMEPYLIVHEVVTGQPRSVQGVFAFFDPLFSRSPTVVELDDVGWRPREVGHDETETREQFAGLPFDLGNDPSRLLLALSLIGDAGVLAERLRHRTRRRRKRQVLDLSAKHLISGKPDRILVGIFFKELVDPPLGKGSIASEERSDCLVSIASHHRLQD